MVLLYGSFIHNILMKQRLVASLNRCHFPVTSHCTMYCNGDRVLVGSLQSSA